MENAIIMMVVVIVLVLLSAVARKCMFKNDSKKNELVRLVTMEMISFYIVISIWELLFMKSASVLWTVLSAFSLVAYSAIYAWRVILNPNSKIMKKSKKRFNVLGLIVITAICMLVCVFFIEILNTSGMMISHVIYGIIAGYTICELYRSYEAKRK